YGPGTLQGRRLIEPCGDAVQFYSTQTTTRLTFTAPDGTEYELRDTTFGGAVRTGNCNNIGTVVNPANRGKTFVSVDGSAMTFISNSDIIDLSNSIPTSGPDIILPTGNLKFKDGTEYCIDHGTVSWIRDRNGNKIAFQYAGGQQVTSITDSLNRQVTICYINTGCGTFYDEIRFKGFGGAERRVRVRYANLRDILRQSQPGEPTEPWTEYQLFPELNGSSSTLYDPPLISSVELPDERRRYYFKYNVYGELARVELPTGAAIEYDWVGAYASGYN